MVATIWIVWRRRETPAELTELVALVRGIGLQLMGIDAKLEVIVQLLEDGDDQENRSDS